jgi:6-pyruvoyltetrahydropterin/6-carboxytetrahydropterin synthase
LCTICTDPGATGNQPPDSSQVLTQDCYKAQIGSGPGQNTMDIFIKTHFCGGHHLRNYPGNCETPHGHNWKVKVTVRADRLDHLGMGIDFKTLKKKVNTLLDQLDHKDLNQLPAFSERNPSSEHIAMYLFDNLKTPLTTDRYRLLSVEVRETDSSGVVYFGD